MGIGLSYIFAIIAITRLVLIHFILEKIPTLEICTIASVSERSIVIDDGCLHQIKLL